jgi:hypothetical protein
MRSRGVIVPRTVVCVDIDTLVKNLATAEYRFNKPQHAYVGEPFRVVLVLPTDPNQNVGEPFKTTQGPIETRTAPYAQYMEARLHGDVDLKITPQGLQERVTTSITPTVWEWTIVPEKPGDKTLIIEVNAQLAIGAEKSRVQLRTIYETIRVQVQFAHLVTAYLAPVWAFVTTLFGFLVSLATLAIGILGVLHYLKARKTEEVPGADLVAHSTQDHDHDKTSSHVPAAQNSQHEGPDKPAAPSSAAPETPANTAASP